MKQENELPNQFKKVLRKYTVSYVIALILIAVVAVSMHIVADVIISQQKEMNDVIALITEQKRLSQTITAKCWEVSKTPDFAIDPEELIQVHYLSQKMLQIHNDLLNRSKRLENPTTQISTMNKIYYGYPYSLDFRVKEFTALVSKYIDHPYAREVSVTLQQITNISSNTLLVTIDIASKQFQKIYNDDIEILRFVLVFMLVVMLLTVIFEAVFIFRPIFRKLIRKELAQLSFTKVLEKRVEEKTQELLLAALVVRETTEGVAVLDSQGFVISVNPAFTTITGYEAEEVTGKNIKLFDGGLMDEPNVQDGLEVLKTKKSLRITAWSHKKNGEAFLETITLNCVKNSRDEEVYVVIFQDVTEQNRQAENIRYMAFHDPLTELPNRHLLQERLERAILRSQREKTKLYVLFLDLDNFKDVNDSLGHHTGDQLLKHIAICLTSKVRKTDTVARMGGDEFLILIENNHDSESIRNIVQQILNSVSAEIEINGNKVFNSASIGIACYPDDGETPEVLMQHADAAMYSAKNAGKNNFKFYTTALGSEG